MTKTGYTSVQLSIKLRDQLSKIAKKRRMTAGGFLEEIVEEKVKKFAHLLGCNPVAKKEKQS